MSLLRTVSLNRGAESRGIDGISTGGRFVPAGDFVEALDNAANNADATKAVIGGSRERPLQHDSATAHDRSPGHDSGAAVVHNASQQGDGANALAPRLPAVPKTLPGDPKGIMPAATPCRASPDIAGEHWSRTVAGIPHARCQPHGCRE